jgi:hypothetical protein
MRVTSRKVNFLFFFLFALQFNLLGQLSIASGSLTTGNISDNTSGLDQDFIGLTAAIEYPIKSFSIRGELSYLFPEEKNSAVNLTGLNYIRGYLGYVFNSGKRFQVPIFFGVSRFSMAGDISTRQWGFGGRSGARFFLTDRIALFGDVTYDQTLSFSSSYTNTLGMISTGELSINSLSFHIGIAYSYSK